MNNIQKAFSNNNAFISYLTAGDGGVDFSVQALLALVKGGVDLLEVGIPFSDPVADGPVIQQGMQRALNAGTTPFDVLEIVQGVRKETDTAIILFSYYNPILALQSRDFLAQAKSAGVDGLLVVDMPLEESEDYQRQCEQAQLSPVFVISPTTALERIQSLDKKTDSFLYYACRKGTTGVRDGLPSDLQDKLATIKSHTNSPVAVGFGIGDRQAAGTALQYADGFVVGSLFVNAITNGATPNDLTTLAQAIDPRNAR